jgi:hypothetical protein
MSGLRVLDFVGHQLHRPYDHPDAGVAPSTVWPSTRVVALKSAR